MFFLELAFAVIVIALGFWLGIKGMHWGFRTGNRPPYDNYFGAWKKRDI